jgi:hypothetical protein
VADGMGFGHPKGCPGEVAPKKRSPQCPIHAKVSPGLPPARGRRKRTSGKRRYWPMKGIDPASIAVTQGRKPFNQVAMWCGGGKQSCRPPRSSCTLTGAVIPNTIRWFLGLSTTLSSRPGSTSCTGRCFASEAMGHMGCRTRRPVFRLRSQARHRPGKPRRRPSTCMAHMAPLGKFPILRTAWPDGTADPGSCAAHVAKQVPASWPGFLLSRTAGPCRCSASAHKCPRPWESPRLSADQANVKPRAHHMFMRMPRQVAQFLAMGAVSSTGMGGKGRRRRPTARSGGEEGDGPSFADMGLQYWRFFATIVTSHGCLLFRGRRVNTQGGISHGKATIGFCVLRIDGHTLGRSGPLK